MFIVSISNSYRMNCQHLIQHFKIQHLMRDLMRRIDADTK